QAALWAGEQVPFTARFLFPGWLYKNIVTINEVRDGTVRTLPFQADAFHYGKNSFPVPDRLGYAGLRVVQMREPLEEVAVFGGASYFRMAGWRQFYGASARGLALNTGLPTP